SFEAETNRSSQPVDLLLPERALVAMGGGKDSLVALDMMLQSGMEVLPACVGSSSLIRDTVKAASLPLLQIRRELSPELMKMNAAGAWNGHVPVTAINSAILVCAALLYGYRYVIFANERSADEATLFDANGNAVNHQYSKSSDFERAWLEVMHDQVSRDLDCFSLLRPFSELEIVRRFSKLKQYHSVYSSCNRNFHLAGEAISGRWCGNCPKCRFAALSLAVFLPPETVIGIMGTDLLDDPEQENGLRELCALGRDKPFECVGEKNESRAALAALNKKQDWRNKVLVKRLVPELAGLEVPSLEALLQPSEKHSIPAAVLSRIQGLVS
ncbi:MAG TPA: endonuclease domain-containing protein, partial [Xanthomonadales bacterium]|nr:endonuclease domain-containing protein [Xanthomonadales bacterium]